jgi:hypothetical protein
MSYIGNAPISAAFLVDTFSGNGSTVAFTMTVAPANTSSIIVAITGVLQDPSTYSVSGTTLTFSAAPPSGTSNISVRYLGIPASGVTTTAYRTVTNFTATAGQTSFSVPSYTVGYIDVYRNGVRLVSTDYTATTGTTVVLNNACTVGDSVVTESFLVSSVLNALPQTGGTLTGQLVVNGATGQNPLVTQVNSSEVMRINSSGNMGLGQSSPTYIFDVYQPASVSSTARARIQGNTNQADWYAANTGGSLYCGVDTSTGTITGTAYGSYVFVGANKPLGFFTNATQKMILQAGGALNITNQPMISARHTSNDSPAGGSPIVNWTLTVNLGGGTWTSGTGAYTVPVTGNYMITCSLLHDSGTNAGGGVYFRINSTNINRMFYIGANLGFVMGSGQLIYALTAGDTVQFIQETSGVVWYGDGGGLGSFTINMLS